MIQMHKHYEATCAPAVIGVSVPAPSRQRLNVQGIDLSQQMLVVVDDCVRITFQGQHETPFSDIALHLLDRAGIPASRIDLNLQRLLSLHRTGDEGGPIDRLTDIFSAVAGHRHVGICVPLAAANEALAILSSATDAFGEGLAEYRALSYRGSERSLFGGPQCGMPADDAFMSQDLFERATAELATVEALRREHRDRMGEMQ